MIINYHPQGCIIAYKEIKLSLGMNFRVSLVVFLSFRYIFPAYCSNNSSFKCSSSFSKSKNFKKSLLERFQSASVGHQELNTGSNQEQLETIHPFKSTNQDILFSHDIAPSFSANNSSYIPAYPNRTGCSPLKQDHTVSSTTSKLSSNPVKLFKKIFPKSHNEDTDREFIMDSNIFKYYRPIRPKLPHIQGNPKVIHLSCGILSWLFEDVRLEPHYTYFCFSSKKRFYLHFGSDNLDDLFLFQYATITFNLLPKKGRVLNEEFKSTTINSICAILSTIASLPLHLTPIYYSFSYGKNNSSLQFMNDYTRVPFYFLFTTISYLLENEHNENVQYLLPLLKLAYQKILNGNKFKSAEWNFLKNFLSQYFDVSDLNFNVLINYNNIQLDISSVSFIYHEMRFGSNEKVKLFFSQVWETSKQECSRKKDLLQISKSPEIFIPSKDGISPNIFEREARKLYQIEFTNLLFKEWNQMEDLLEEFAQLKSYFDNINIDFRLRTFSANDFELLNGALENIYSLLERFSFNEILLVHSFLVELEYFINFKCFLLIFDFCNELKESGSGNFLYQKTLETITTISKLFKKIHSFTLSRNVELPRVNLDIVQPNFWSNLSLLQKLVAKIAYSSSTNSTELVNERQSNLDELSRYLSFFEYFGQKPVNFNILKFERTRLLSKLDEILTTNEEKCINEIFLDKNYKNIMGMCNLKLLEHTKRASVENKIRFLQKFKNFLFLNNQ